MLKHLTITNLAVISHLQVEFGPGLNILSGETGSGKSIILSALGLVLGERASQDLLRTGETRAIVTAVFEVQDNFPLQKLLEDAGIELVDVAEDDLIIKREIIANGRGKVFLNNQAATLQLLKSIQPHLIDVHGQGEHQSLLSTGVQTTLLDSFARADQARSALEEAFDKIAALLAELKALRQSEAERLQMLDLVEYQLQEIEGASLRPEEDLELEGERNILVNAERLTMLCNEITRALYEEDQAVMRQLGVTEKRLSELSTIDPYFERLSEQLSGAKYALEDIVFGVRDYATRVTFSPGRLQQVEERLALLERLRRKYGKTLNDIIIYACHLKEKNEALQNRESIELGLQNTLNQESQNYQTKGKALSRQRTRAAQELEKKIKNDLLEVALEKAQFKIRFKEPLGGIELPVALGGQKIYKTGHEIAEFYFSANPGEDLRAMSAVASGGELSRLMLILKSNISPTPYPRTLVFDEVDTGIGGRVADAVGVRLRKLAQTNQVICVTHQAQIARYGTVHLKVKKYLEGTRTLSTISRLDYEERVEEIARMMAGAAVTRLTREHAEELLAPQEFEKEQATIKH